MKRNLFVFLMTIIPCFAIADDCLVYKLVPKVNLSVPKWEKEVVQPLRPIDFMHGNVVATLTQNYEMVVDTTSIEDGFCISLKSVDGVIGYSDFLVNIDSRHYVNSCSYDAILLHEDEHINVYLSVIDNLKSEIKDAVVNASNSIMPVFIRDEKDVEKAFDTMNKKLESHPDIVLIRQKIKAEEEIRNKRIDQNNPGTEFKQCFE